MKGLTLPRSYNIANRVLQTRLFGQPAAQTHPHLLSEDDVTPGINRQHYKTRRTKFMESVLKRQKILDWNFDKHIVIIPSSTVQYMTNDIPYVFRQHTDFLYLSGFQEPDSVLVLEADKHNLPEHKSTLFVQKKDPHRELWEGQRSGTAGTVSITGVDEARNIQELSGYLNNLISSQSKTKLWYNNSSPAHLPFHNHLASFVSQFQTNTVDDPMYICHELRVLKSDEEVKLMQKSNDIAGQAFREVMKFSGPNVDEAHLWAKMDFECRIRGAEYLAYPPVVAGGNRANTIHYIRNNQLVADNELVLMDAGCEYHGYASDLTRTWPVSGRFTEPQRELYEVLLAVQEACIDMCRQHDRSLDDMLIEMLHFLAVAMRSIGVIKYNTADRDLMRLARQLCPHHLGHYLGMDVHDTVTISVARKLQPGIVITIEPGVYIPETRSDVPKWFRGMGIRIEDNILITESGYHNLTTCPKAADDIERIMAR